MYAYPEPVKTLIEEFEKLPGVGRRTAERFAFYVLNSRREEAQKLSRAVSEVKERIKQCSVCFNLTDRDPCGICASGDRDAGTICVVEQPVDVISIEKSEKYKGLYHVLMGSLSPLKGITPRDINMEQLFDRIGNTEVKEVIIATDSDDDGNTTAQYIARRLKPSCTKVTRIATGIPVGQTLEFSDSRTLSEAIEGRREQN